MTDGWSWTCHVCHAGKSGYPTLEKVEAAQIRHAKGFHWDEPGYTVTSQGRVIYRVR